MKQNCVSFTCELICDNPGPDTGYRLYINDELLSERNFRCQADQSYKEIVNVSAVAGRHLIHVFSLDAQSRVRIADISVVEGPARVDANKYLIVT